MIDRFFRPFLGGIFFDSGLSTSSRLFQFVMRMLATGTNCLPAGGIGSVTDQLAARLPENSILTGRVLQRISFVLFEPLLGVVSAQLQDLICLN